MKMSRRKQANRWMITAVLSLVLILINQKETLAQEVEVTLVDGSVDGYATFNSHSQKVVSNKNGIFMTHMTARKHKPANWLLSKSTDGEKTFSTIYVGDNTKKPPVIETDQDDNIYVMHFKLERSANTAYRLYFYRFMANADGSYGKPIITSIDAGFANGESTFKGKKTMIYDQVRQQFYVWGPGLFIINKSDGAIRFSKMMFTKGGVSVQEYPHFTFGNDGMLYASFTTQKRPAYLYYDIRVMKSPDGGITWKNLAGTVTHQLPLKADDSALDRITHNGEFGVHTWLTSAYAKGGKLHFAYDAQLSPTHKFTYMRYDAKTGVREIDNRNLKGGNISIHGSSGFFASRDNTASSPLYYIGRTGPGEHAGFQGGGNKIGVLVSYDNGDTWNDYAQSAQIYNKNRIFALGGSRKIVDDGYILGSFTEVGRQARVYAFRIKADSLSPGFSTPDTISPPTGLQVVLQ